MSEDPLTSVVTPASRRRSALLIAGVRHLLVLLCVVAISVVLAFGVLEIPAMNRLVAPDLPYHALRRAYVPDSLLVFTPAFRGEPHRMTFIYRGDLYSEDFGVPVEPIAVDISYDASGFRTNGSTPPYEIAVIGDSYVDLSETDDNTFSEHLADRTGRSTVNLGTAWYGPYQYVEILKNVAAAPQPPRHALLMFYAGNDIADIEEYERWRNGGPYHGQDPRYWDASITRRFTIAARQATRAIASKLEGVRRRFRGRSGQANGGDTTHPELAFIALDGRKVPMAMGAPSPHAGAQTLLNRDAWYTLRMLVDEFRRESDEHGIVPVIVYLPTKMQTYADFIDDSSGRDIREMLQAQRAYAGAQAQALATVAHDAGICFIDVLPRFRSLAADGQVLYHPFDTHWNDRGRTAAAEVVAGALTGCAQQQPARQEARAPR